MTEIEKGINWLNDIRDNYMENERRYFDMAVEALFEIQQYRAIGTIEECHKARKIQKVEEKADPVRQLVNIPSTDEKYKSTLRRATIIQIHQALKWMEGKNGKRSRIAACLGELRKRKRDQERVLAAYNLIQNYCIDQECCGECLFQIEKELSNMCVMECQDVPAEWQRLKLD